MDDRGNLSSNLVVDVDDDNEHDDDDIHLKTTIGMYVLP
jgi:hypothetical protein